MNVHSKMLIFVQSQIHRGLFFLSLTCTYTHWNMSYSKFYIMLVFGFSPLSGFFPFWFFVFCFFCFCFFRGFMVFWALYRIIWILPLKADILDINIHATRWKLGADINGRIFCFARVSHDMQNIIISKYNTQFCSILY